MFHIQISVHAFSEKKQAAWVYCLLENAVNMVLASYSGLGNLAVDFQMGS